MKDISTLSEHLDGLSATRRSAEQHIDTAINALGAAHEQLAKVSEHLTQLLGDTAGTGALGELAEYAKVARELTAEVTLLVSRLRPKEMMARLYARDATTSRTDIQDKVAAVIADARSGMLAKRLAKWEAEELREAVVEKLAGDAPR